MKKYKFFALAFAALTLGACSSDDVVDNGQPGTVPAGEPGYVSLAINLPTQPSSRANDNFDDGLPVEYQVEDATLLLFSGANEADATFASAYNLDVTGFSTNDPADDQITSKATLVQEITVPATTSTEHIYALVVLNDNGLINVSSGTATLNDGTSLAGMTFKALTEETQTLTGSSALTANGFFMSNAPLYSVAGGTVNPENGSVTTLAEIDKNKIHPTQAEASSDPAANIYVERAVAKVTVNATEGDQSVSDGNPLLASYNVAGWAFNVANTKTFVVRNVAPATPWWQYTNEDVTDYRFVGSSAVATGLYRTYWGIDPNYDQAYNASDFIMMSGKELDNKTLYGFGENHPGYCLENTFNVANQINNRTTQVVVKAKLTIEGAENDGTFYTLNGNTSTVYQESGVISEVQRRVMEWLEANKATYVKNGDITGTSLDVVLSNAATDEGGVISVTSATFADEDVTGIEWQDGQSLERLNEAIAAQVTQINADLTISYYKGGYAYYPILVQHFGDTQTPWESDGNVGESYPDPNAEANWLGRYGVLRNNWYEINVTGIKNIGSPSVPDVTNNYDDPENSYIAVTINVLSWAKRTQSADL